MDTKQAALFYLRFTAYDSLKFTKQENNKYFYVYQTSRSIHNLGLKLQAAFYDNKTEIVFLPTGEYYQFPAAENIENPIEFVENEWLGMSRSFFNQLRQKDFWLYTLLFPYLIQKPQESIKVEVENKQQVIKIENLTDLVTLYAFFPPSPKKTKQDDKYYYVEFEFPASANFSSFDHYQPNKTIYRSFITFPLVKNMLELFQSPNCTSYLLQIPKPILHEFAFFKGKNLSDKEVHWIFWDIEGYKWEVENNDYQKKKFEQRLIIDNFILL